MEEFGLAVKAEPIEGERSNEQESRSPTSLVKACSKDDDMHKQQGVGR